MPDALTLLRRLEDEAIASTLRPFGCWKMLIRTSRAWANRCSRATTRSVCAGAGTGVPSHFAGCLHTGWGPSCRAACGQILRLLGPHGPLPTHLTEYVRDRVRNANDPTFARFLDIFHHRMVTLFYRAWANAQPAVSLDRPGRDRFSFYVGSLFGLGEAMLRERDAVPDFAKLHFAGLLAGPTRPAAGLSSY